MMCMTELHGGVCDRTSTPHKSGIRWRRRRSSLNVLGGLYILPTIIYLRKHPPLTCMQRRSQDFCLGGAPGRCHPVHFPSPPEADQIEWGGGGVVADIFRVLKTRTTFSGGGGGCGRRLSPLAAGEDQSNCLNSGTFIYVTHHLFFLATSIHSWKNHLPKVLGGGHGPHDPPGYATACMISPSHSSYSFIDCVTSYWNRLSTYVIKPPLSLLLFPWATQSYPGIWKVHVSDWSRLQHSCRHITLNLNCRLCSSSTNVSSSENLAFIDWIFRLRTENILLWVVINFLNESIS